MAISFKKVSHIIFDLDDTLLSTEHINDSMLSDLVKAHGKILPDGFRSRFLGSPIRTVTEALINELKIDVTLDKLIEESKTMALEKYQTIKLALMPGAERLVRHFHKHNIQMAIATSSFKKEAELKTTQPHLVEFFKLISHIVTNDDVENGKPAPDIYLKAASLFPANPESCLVFEDAINGINAAKQANMQRIWIPKVAEISHGVENLTTMILRSLEDFQPELFGLPAFD